MYLAHFGLKELPFGITPDTSFVFSSLSHQEALNTLLLAVQGGEGFIKITGEVGTGKTLLCRRFLNSLDEQWITAYVPNPRLDPGTLLLAVSEELNLRLDSSEPDFHLIKYLNAALLEHARQGKSVVLCLDEAQAIPLESLESLRLLSNLETEKRKLLQIVMFGQPELDLKLSDPSVRQLRQRIAFHHRLSGLRPEEIEGYLAHRLRVAGYRGERLFAEGIGALFHRLSRGAPRVINVLAHKALLLAFGQGRMNVDRQHVRIAALDTESVAAPSWWHLAARFAR